MWSKKDLGRTFSQAGEPEELHEAQVVPADQHRCRMVRVHGIDLRQVRVLGPDATDFWSQDAAPRGPAETFQVLLGDKWLSHCSRGEEKNQARGT